MQILFISLFGNLISVSMSEGPYIRKYGRLDRSGHVRPQHVETSRGKRHAQVYPDSDRAIFNSLATNRTFLNCDYCPTLCVVCNVSSAPDFPPSGEKKHIYLCF